MRDVIIGIDSGTSVVKAVAFDLAGRQLSSFSVANRYVSGADGSVTQPLDRTWQDCVHALRGLGETIDNLAGRTAALSVTAQGDGTWLVGPGDQPICDAWLWLDARAAATVKQLAGGADDRARFELTGTGLNTCQQGAQLAHMDRFSPEILDRAEAALHCKDWLYLKLTGIRATDPSESSFTFGNFRTRRYEPDVFGYLGLAHRQHLLPPIIDGTQVLHGLKAEAARETGLLPGTPVCLGFVDMVMTALGAGVYGGSSDTACSIVGSTGVHMRATHIDDVRLNSEGTGYIMALPVPGMVVQAQTNMAASLNLDWILSLGAELLGEMGHETTARDLMARIETWLQKTTPGQILYHPYISEAGERGPFVDAQARAGFTGLSAGHRYPDLVRAVVDGLGMAMRDCYTAMGSLPSELRLSGGAARSRGLRSVLSAAVNAPIRVSEREEAGAAGAAMMAAVAIGAYEDMDSCVAEWVTPLLAPPERPDAALAATYDRLFPAFLAARQALVPSWKQLAAARSATLQRNIT